MFRNFKSPVSLVTFWNITSFVFQNIKTISFLNKTEDLLSVTYIFGYNTRTFILGFEHLQFSAIKSKLSFVTSIYGKYGFILLFASNKNNMTHLWIHLFCHGVEQYYANECSKSKIDVWVLYINSFYNWFLHQGYEK